MVRNEKTYVRFVKPLMDKLVALLLIVTLFIPGIFLSFILAIVNNGKVFFFHERVGKENQLFRLIKFKTMQEDSRGTVKTTSVGSVLRKLSIDELPQLINVLKGDMSLVGPRPLLTEYLPYYSEEEKRRHEVVPGITGWAQVNGRNHAGWEQRMLNDNYYVEHISFLLDLRILFLTCIQIFKLSQADFETEGQETFVEYAKKR